MSNRKKRNSKEGPTLEDSIHAAKISVEDDRSHLVIAMNAFASRKRNRLCNLSVAKDQLDDIENEAPSNAADDFYWKKKFEILNEEFDKKAKELSSELAVSLKRYANLDRYTKLLEGKMELVVNESKKSFKNAEHYENLVRQYYLMTGMEIVAEEEKSELKSSSLGSVSSRSRFICALQNTTDALRKIKFRVSQLEGVASDSNMHYEPIEFPTNTMTSSLPDYLKESIIASQDMCPVITSDLLQALYE